MLFVLSAAARFHSKPIAECAVRSSPRLGHKTRGLVAELKRLEAKDIRKQLHVNDALAKQYFQHLNNFESQRPVPACALYDTPLYDALGFAGYDEDDGEWANSYVRIFSGLYGLVRPYDEIQPLSLPVNLNTKLANSKGKFLRDYWQGPVEKELEEGLKNCPIPVIVNCANEADSEGVLDSDRLPEGTRVMHIEFRSLSKSGSIVALGEFIHWALENRCMSVEELLEFKGYGVEAGDHPLFRLNSKNKDSNKLVFEEATDEGGDGGWVKKISDYGGTKREFIKEFASTKNRYKRSEINKAIAKDQKKRRGSLAVY